jgi:uncharacterized membrane protein
VVTSSHLFQTSTSYKWHRLYLFTTAMDPLTPEQLAALAKEDRGPLTKSIVVAFTCIAVICVGLRLFTRLRYLGRALGWEDYTIVVSMALAIATGVLQVMQANAGNGKHAPLIEFPGGVETILKVRNPSMYTLLS